MIPFSNIHTNNRLYVLDVLVHKYPVFKSIHSSLNLHHVVKVAQISLTLSHHFSYRSLSQAGLLDNIPYPHIVAECMFVLVVLVLHGHVWGP